MSRDNCTSPSCPSVRPDFYDCVIPGCVDRSLMATDRIGAKIEMNASVLRMVTPFNAMNRHKYICMNLRQGLYWQKRRMIVFEKVRRLLLSRSN